ncbi:hypothetical protein MMC06_006757, partial [Schaereria dolodes]|nr:hypothetical protein [Schaereria dolodes]
MKASTIITGALLATAIHASPIQQSPTPDLTTSFNTELATRREKPFKCEPWKAEQEVVQEGPQPYRDACVNQAEEAAEVERLKAVDSQAGKEIGSEMRAADHPPPSVIASGKSRCNLWYKNYYESHTTLPGEVYLEMCRGMAANQAMGVARQKEHDEEEAKKKEEEAKKQEEKARKKAEKQKAKEEK